jgi:1-aminocyclopropane-1-carboxylate deaminase
MTLPSPIDKICLFNTQFYVKRDDLIHPMYSGNKYRKLHTYFNQPSLKPIVSYGGYQSNAMLSIAYYCYQHKISFTYITKSIPNFINHSDGNLALALKHKMKLVEVSNDTYQNTIDTLNTSYPDSLIIKQGAAEKEAEHGLKILAKEIHTFIQEHDLKKVAVFIPSGTGTSALFLQKHLKDITVYTTPCVGNSDYLNQQWQELEPNLTHYPTILETKKKYHFAKPYAQFLESYKSTKEQDIEFDLIYSPKLLLAIQENLSHIKEKTKIIIHTGGVIGNSTQLARYQFKGFSV